MFIEQYMHIHSKPSYIYINNATKKMTLHMIKIVIVWVYFTISIYCDLFGIFFASNFDIYI